MKSIIYKIQKKSSANKNYFLIYKKIKYNAIETSKDTISDQVPQTSVQIKRGPSTARNVGKTVDQSDPY